VPTTRFLLRDPAFVENWLVEEEIPTVEVAPNVKVMAFIARLVLRPGWGTNVRSSAGVSFLVE
jgi:hypothetical protein